MTVFPVETLLKEYSEKKDFIGKAMTTETLKQLEEAYRQTFDSDLSLLKVQVNKDGENGLFINPDGLVYDFATNHKTGESVCVVNDSLTKDFNDFALGYLTVHNYNVDSLGRLRSEAYGFLSGLKGVRSDADKIAGKCGRGWEMGSGGKCVRGKKKGGTALRAGLAGAALLGGAALGAAMLGRNKQKALPGTNQFDKLKQKALEQQTVDVKSRTVGGDLARRK